MYSTVLYGEMWMICRISESFLCRLVLRCRQDARQRFARLRQDVMVKLELLDQKHGKLPTAYEGGVADE